MAVGASPGSAAPVEIGGLGYAYGEGELRRPVLRDIDLTIRPGEIVLLTGPSGSGKTTLLTLVGALRAMQEGSCRVLGQELLGASEAQRVALRRRIGFIFQQHNLLGFLTAQQNVAMAIELDPRTTEAGRLDRADGDAGGGRARRSRASRPASCPAASGSASRWPGRWPASPG